MVLARILAEHAKSVVSRSVRGLLLALQGLDNAVLGKSMQRLLDLDSRHLGREKG